MSPMYCDYTGKEITPQCGSTNPAPNRDYYTFGNKIISADAWDELQDNMEKLMSKRGFGNYSFEVYKQLIQEVADKVILKGAKPRPGNILG